MKKRIWKYIKWGIILAAAVCLMTVIVRAELAPDHMTGPVTAEKVTEYYRHGQHALLEGIAVKQYEVEYGTLKALLGEQLPVEVTALPVYTPQLYVHESRYWRQAKKNFLQAVTPVLGKPLAQKLGNYHFADCDARVQLRADQGTLKVRYYLNGFAESSPYAAVLPENAEQSEYARVAEPVIELLSQVMGKAYTVQSMKTWMLDSPVVGIIACPAEDDPVRQLYTQAFDCITVSFHEQSDGSMALQSAYITDYLLVEAIEAEPLISLEEAEKHLRQGYIFSGHQCLLCMQGRDGVDFTEYDAVTLRYRENALAIYDIPYYAFYKQLEEGKYAVAYVAAVKVQGIEEYFASMEAFFHGA